MLNWNALDADLHQGRRRRVRRRRHHGHRHVRHARAGRRDRVPRDAHQAAPEQARCVRSPSPPPLWVRRLTQLPPAHRPHRHVRRPRLSHAPALVVLPLDLVDQVALAHGRRHAPRSAPSRRAHHGPGRARDRVLARRAVCSRGGRRDRRGVRRRGGAARGQGVHERGAPALSSLSVSPREPELIRSSARPQALPAKLQLLTLSAKLLVLSHLAPLTPPTHDALVLLFQYVALVARYDRAYEVRDRARFLAGLVSAGGIGRRRKGGEGDEGEGEGAKVVLSAEDFARGVSLEDVGAAGANGGSGGAEGEEAQTMTGEQVRAVLFDGKAFEAAAGASLSLLSLLDPPRPR